MRALITFAIAGALCVSGSEIVPRAPARSPARRTELAYDVDSAQLTRLVDSVMQAGMKQEHIPGAAVLISFRGRVLLSKGYGVADISSGQAVNPSRTRFPFASITKMITATAAMQLVERGRLALDRDVNSYLKTARVPDSRTWPITLAHLLTHTDLLDEIPGRQVARREARHSLGEFLAPRLRRTGQPGTVTRYGTYGMALAGLLVEDVTGQRYADYLDAKVFRPLGMSSTTIDPPLRGAGSLATPYRYENGKTEVVPYEWYETTPTSSLVSTVTDMGRFMDLHLGHAPSGTGNAVLRATTIRAMARQHATVHPSIPGWGYGWQLSDANGLRGVEHGGDIGGFSSLLTLLPDQDFGLVVVHHLEGTNLRFTLKKTILDRFFPGALPVVPRSAIAQTLEPFAGAYLANIYCHTCADGIAGAQRFEIAGNADGSVSLWGVRWYPTTTPLLFASADGSKRIGFAVDSVGRAFALSGGSWKVLERAP